MRKETRYEDNAQYWDRRWTEAGRDEDEFADLSIYPIRYAELVMTDPSRRALELGAGLGRLLKHYRGAGFKIAGLERSEAAVRRLRAEDPSFDIQAGDVRSLPYADGEFEVVLAFGLFHNLEEGMGQALSETERVLAVGGSFCISMRPDNLEMRFNEWYWRRRQKDRTGEMRFHKWLVGEDEFRQLLGRHGLRVDEIHRARNVSLLYRIPWLRARSAGEAERRSRGYRLNAAGRALDRALVLLAPRQFCNVVVFVGRKAG